MLSYLNQLVALEKCEKDINGNIITDIYGKPSYSSITNIRVRQSPINEEIRNERGMSIICKTEYYTMAFVSFDDLIDSKRVIHVEPYYGFSGNRIGVRCLV